MSCGVGGRRGSDPELLWLWHRTAAVAPIRPVAWEPPYDTGVARKSKVTIIIIKCIRILNPLVNQLNYKSLSLYKNT